MAPRILFALIVLLAAINPFSYCADNPPGGPNSDPTYQQLRNLTLGGEAVSVSNFALKRDAGTFHLRSGTVCFVAAVKGKVTGAVFTGDGNFVLDRTARLGAQESEAADEGGRVQRKLQPGGPALYRLDL